MKKLLLAAVIMLGVGTAASAQTSEALKAKKEAAKKQAGQPSFSTAPNDPSVVAKEKEAKPAEAADKATASAKAAEEPKKTATPAPAVLKKEKN